MNHILSDFIATMNIPYRIEDEEGFTYTLDYMYHRHSVITQSLHYSRDQRGRGGKFITREINLKNLKKYKILEANFPNDLILR